MSPLCALRDRWSARVETDFTSATARGAVPHVSATRAAARAKCEDSTPGIPRRLTRMEPAVGMVVRTAAPRRASGASSSLDAMRQRPLGELLSGFTAQCASTNPSGFTFLPFQEETSQRAAGMTSRANPATPSTITLRLITLIRIITNTSTIVTFSFKLKKFPWTDCSYKPHISKMSIKSWQKTLPADGTFTR